MIKTMNDFLVFESGWVAQQRINHVHLYGIMCWRLCAPARWDLRRAPLSRGHGTFWRSRPFPWCFHACYAGNGAVESVEISFWEGHMAGPSKESAAVEEHGSEGTQGAKGTRGTSLVSFQSRCHVALPLLSHYRLSFPAIMTLESL